MPERNAYFFKSFSHESRNELLKLLADHGEMTVEALTGASSITSSTVSRHLGLLKMQGVVGVRAEPPAHYYYLNETEITKRMREFLAFLNLQTKP